MSTYQILPQLAEQDFLRLKEDIRERGAVLVPIEVDEEGVVLDGHHRLRAVEELNKNGAKIPQPKKIVRKGLAEHEKRLLVVSLNAARRHLTDGQKMLVGLAIEPDIIERARRRMAHTDEQGENTYGQLSTGPKSRDEVAAVVGLGTGKTYERGKKVLKQIESEMPKVKASEIRSKVETGEWEIKQAKRELNEFRREQRRKKNQKKLQSASDGNHVPGTKYSTIVIDPPWDWGDEGDADQLGRARPIYATMRVEEIRALPIADLADDDSHLYVWITNRSLPKGFGLLEAWGFRYITTLTWCKPSIGMGNYFRGSTEHLLFGVRGSLMLKRKDIGTWFSAARPGRHSGKPEEAFDLIEQCSPGPYLEVFPGEHDRSGWTHWGVVHE